MESRSKNVKRNIGWGIINCFVSIILPFLTRTAVVYSIGIEYTGLDSLFHSVLSVMNLAELGIGSAMVFSMYKPIAEMDEEKVCALLNLYRKCYRIIGMIVLGIGTASLLFINRLIAGNVPNNVNICILFIIYIVDDAIGYLLFAYKTSLFTASQRVDWISRITIIVQFLKCIIRIVGVVYFKNYYIYAIALPVTTLLNNLLIHYLAGKEFPNYRCIGELNREDKVAIKKKVGGMVFQKIGHIILTSADTIVISAFFGLRVLGIYNGYYYIITALAAVLSVVQRSLIPSIGNSIVKENTEKNYSNFNIIGLLYIWIIGWSSTCLLCLYQPFITLWQGSENTFSFPVVIMFTVYYYTFHMGDMIHMYKEALGLWWEGKFVPIVSSLLNLILNVVLVQLIGIYGILISTIISVTFINVPILSKIVFKYYFEDNGHLWKKYLGEVCLYFVITFIVSTFSLLIVSGIHINGYIGLFIKATYCLIVPNIFYLFAWKKFSYYKGSVEFIAKIIPNRFRSIINKIM